MYLVKFPPFLGKGCKLCLSSRHSLCAVYLYLSVFLFDVEALMWIRRYQFQFTYFIQSVRFVVNIKENQDEFPTLFRLLKLHITKTSLFKYTEYFTSKNGKFSDKNSYISHISAQSMNYGYSLEPPRFLSKNKKYNAYPCKP